MMLLSGAMFPFDKLNRQIGSVEKVPVIAELIPTRWTYEALMVTQFKDNRYSRVEYDKEKETYYMLRKKISEAEFNKTYRIKELRDALEISATDYKSAIDPGKPDKFSKLRLLGNELTKMASFSHVPEFHYISDLTPDKFNTGIADSLGEYLNRMDKEFSKISNSASDKRDRFYTLNETKLNTLENSYYNYKLEEIVTKPYERKKILVNNNTLIQNTDLIYLDSYNRGFLNFRTHFYAPDKYIFGIKTDTFVFNISLVLFSTVLLYLLLYYELPGRFVSFFENLKIRK